MHSIMVLGSSEEAAAVILLHALFHQEDEKGIP